MKYICYHQWTRESTTYQAYTTVQYKKLQSIRAYAPAFNEDNPRLTEIG